MTAKKENGNGLSMIQQNYPVLDPASEAAEIIRINLRDESLGLNDLDRIKVPSGGGAAWEVPTYKGVELQKSVEGIILHIARRRAYWSNPNPSGDVPDCQSQDMVTGFGKPGGDCETCPCNQWGSARKADGAMGRGKACRERKLLFLLPPNQRLPVIVDGPPSSLGAIKNYQAKLPMPFYACVTRLSLRKVQSKDGVAYAEIVPEFVSEISKDDAARVREFALSIVSVLEAAATKAAASSDGE